MTPHNSSAESESLNKDIKMIRKFIARYRDYMDPVNGCQGAQWWRGLVYAWRTRS